jgi:hypothetical protein
MPSCIHHTNICTFETPACDYCPVVLQYWDVAIRTLLEGTTRCVDCTQWDMMCLTVLPRECVARLHQQTQH